MASKLPPPTIPFAAFIMWRASDNSRFIVLTSLVKKWRTKNFDATPNKKSHFVALRQKG
jgi:hypothetical protein